MYYYHLLHTHPTTTLKSMDKGKEAVQDHLHGFLFLLSFWIAWTNTQQDYPSHVHTKNTNTPDGTTRLSTT